MPCARWERNHVVPRDTSSHHNHNATSAPPTCLTSIACCIVFLCPTPLSLTSVHPVEEKLWLVGDHDRLPQFCVHHVGVRRHLATKCCPGMDGLPTALIHIPANILYKSTAGRYRPVSYPDGPITSRYRFTKNAYWGTCLTFGLMLTRRLLCCSGGALKCVTLVLHDAETLRNLNFMVT